MKGFVCKASGCGNLLNNGSDVKIATAFAIHKPVQSLAMTINEQNAQVSDTTGDAQRTEAG